MPIRTPYLLRGLALFMVLVLGLFLLVAAAGTTLAKSQPGGAASQVAFYAPSHDGTPEGTETEQPEGTETERPEGTETEHPEATETEHPEGTETEHPEGTETEHPEGTETEHPRGTETEHPRGTETKQPGFTPTTTTTPGAANVPGTGARVFPETGKAVTGVFLNYWNKNGGLMQQGYPISAPVRQTSSVNGQSYVMQYFERAVFEYHSENAAPYNVLLSQLGTFRYNAKYPNAAPNQVANRTNGHFFPETKHWVGSVFWQYWQQHGGLMQQGYPISDEFSEVSALNGKRYTVQYFERAVFEYHPENRPPYDVLLSQLGTYHLQQRNK